jgi:O-antigen/teichoic acid export membrane protein
MFVSSVVNRIKRARHLFATDSLFRNATYLTASTAVMSLLGFLFWFFVAHLYSPSQIGVASALISIATLTSTLSLLGLNAGIIRFLPSSKDQSRDINAAAIVIAGATTLLAAAYAFVGTRLTGATSLLASTTNKFAFTALMVTVSLNSLTDSVFIARRRGEYHTAGYTALGLIKLLLPLFLVPLGAAGIFGAYILSMLVSLLLSLYLMVRGCGYHFFARPNWKIIAQIRAYATHNYIGGVLAGLAPQLMPQFIIRSIGDSSVAYYSMAWTMANLLYVVPSAAMQSLLAEASHDPEKKNEQIARMIKTLIFILIPAVTVAVLIAPFMLRLFGAQYQRHATAIFQIFALATFFVASSTIGNTLLNIERKTGGIVAMQIVNLVTTFGSAAWLIRYGLPGIGLTMLLGNVMATTTFLILFLQLRRKRKKNRLDDAQPFPLSMNHQMIAMLLSAYNITEFAYKALLNGSTNTTLIIGSPSGKAVLRIYEAPGTTVRKIAEEVTFMEHLATHGIPTPQVFQNRRGKKLSRTTINGVDRYYILMEYAPGHHPSSYSMRVLADMAARQAQIHLGGLQYASRLQKRHLLAVAVPYGFSHFDFDASNILVEDEHISSILDFEGMRYGPLIGCIYFTLTHIYDAAYDPALPLAYVRMYQKTRKLRTLEKSALAILLSLRYRNMRFLRILTT